MRVTIYHNPQCSNSRGCLSLLREHGFEPQIIEYLKTPLSKDELRAVVAKLNIPLRDVIRAKESIYSVLNLESSKTDDELLDAMVAHPILLNRPIVVTDLGARLCRPPEIAQEILP